FEGEWTGAADGGDHSHAPPLRRNRPAEAIAAHRVGHRLYTTEDIARLQQVLNSTLDPASPQAQALAQRWDELTERTMRGYEAFPDVKQAIADNYKQGQFEGHSLAPQAADVAFIERVKTARHGTGESGSAGTKAR